LHSLTRRTLPVAEIGDSVIDTRATSAYFIFALSLMVFRPLVGKIMEALQLKPVSSTNGQDPLSIWSMAQEQMEDQQQK
jgi:hypothetical protein